MNNNELPLIFDAHLDLAMNAMEWNRDLRWTVADIRDHEQGMADKPDRGRGTVSLPALRNGNIGICVATQISRYVKKGSQLPGWNSQEQAWAMTQAQLAWYRTMEASGHLRQITDVPSLDAHLDYWQGRDEPQAIGYILSLEGADSLVDLGYLEVAYNYGLRAIGPAHYGPGVYAQGTNATGGIGQKGRELLRKMEALNIILDATHLCDDSFREALDHFHGPVWASHSNCRTLVDHNRQFTDEQILELVGRGAIIGMPLDAWMMIPGWLRGQSDPERDGVTLRTMVEHLDHICQLTGSSTHIGIGTDLDGGFGKEQCPADLDTIADLQKVPELLTERGYTPADIEGILSGNWLRFLRQTWG